ncbi:unnamed protein product [Ixodes hexagonus]
MIELKNVSAVNYVGLLTFSILVGLVLAAFRDQHNAVLNLLISLSDTMMTVTYIVMWCAPLGLLSTTIGMVLSPVDMASTINDMIMYFMTALIALLVHGLVTMPCLYMALSQRHLGPFFFFFTHPLAVAFGSASR